MALIPTYISTTSAVQMSMRNVHYGLENFSKETKDFLEIINICSILRNVKTLIGSLRLRRIGEISDTEKTNDNVFVCISVLKVGNGKLEGIDNAQSMISRPFSQKEMIVESHSPQLMIDALLEVYDRFRKDIKEQDIGVHAVDCLDVKHITEKTASRFLSSFLRQIEHLPASIPSKYKLRAIITTKVNEKCVLSNLEKICSHIDLEHEVKYIGNVTSPKCIYYRPSTVRKLKEKLLEDAGPILAEEISEAISDGIYKHIKSKLAEYVQEGIQGLELNMSLSPDTFMLPVHISVIITTVVVYFLFFSPFIMLLAAVTYGFSLLFNYVDINSRSWRDDVAKELKKKIDEKVHELVEKLTVDIDSLLNKCKNEIEKFIPVLMNNQLQEPTRFEPDVCARQFKDNTFRRYKYHKDLVDGCLADASYTDKLPALIKFNKDVQDTKLREIFLDDCGIPADTEQPEVLVYFLKSEDNATSIAWLVWKLSERDDSSSFKILVQHSFMQAYETTTDQWKIVKNDAKTIREHVSSCFETKLLHLLKDGKTKRDTCYIRAVKNRIMRCSSLTKSKPESDIHSQMSTLLKRFDSPVSYFEQENGTIVCVVQDIESQKQLRDAINNAFSGYPSKLSVQIEIGKSSIQNFANPGQKLQGERFLQMLTTTEEFMKTHPFATIGGLAELNEEEGTVAVTCQHACPEDTIVYTMLGKNVVEFGKGSFCKPEGAQNYSINEDISIIRLSEQVLPLVQKIEKMLVDKDKYPCPSKISDLSPCSEIVHKWGAASGSTTGTASPGAFNSVQVLYVEIDFSLPGDSGSLVYRYSDDTDLQELHVLALIKGIFSSSTNGVEIQGSKQILCIPLKQCIEELPQRFPTFRALKFYQH